MKNWTIGTQIAVVLIYVPCTILRKFKISFQRRYNDYIKRQKDNLKHEEEDDVQESGPALARNKITQLTGKNLNLDELRKALNQQDETRGEPVSFLFNFVLNPQALFWVDLAHLIFVTKKSI